MIALRNAPDPSTVADAADLDRIEGPFRVRLRAPLPLLTPYYNQWGADAYTRRGPYHHRAEELPATSTAGACVVLGERFFAGVTGTGGLSFRHDGVETLTIEAEAGRTLWHTQSEGGFEGWRGFHRQTGLRARPILQSVPRHWRLPEYGT